jgi:hypothetical protein
VICGICILSEVPEKRALHTTGKFNSHFILRHCSKYYIPQESTNISFDTTDTLAEPVQSMIDSATTRAFTSGFGKA